MNKVTRMNKIVVGILVASGLLLLVGCIYYFHLFGVNPQFSYTIETIKPNIINCMGGIC